MTTEKLSFGTVQIVDTEQRMWYNGSMAKDNNGHGAGYTYTTKEIVHALDLSEGGVFAAAQLLKCSVTTIQRRARKSPAVAEALSKHRVRRTDKAENQLELAIDRGEQWAVIYQLRTQAKDRGYYGEHVNEIEKQEDEEKEIVNPLPFLPADMIAPEFLDAYRDIKAGRHREYVFRGGRGSTKSSFVSLVVVYLLLNNPDCHVLAVRQVADTLRTSVYGQIEWAISVLGLTQYFKFTYNPMEITYIPTGQKIFFRGADDPNKIKSIKPTFGYIGILWFEELDQFRGEESIRKVEQSAIRGGDVAFIIKSFNPPRTIGNWANKYIKIPKETQYQHESTFLTVPKEWLGKAFFEEAKHLSEVNPDAYEHEYLGVANGAGGMIFENITARRITDEEIYGTKDPSTGLVQGGFDYVYHGLDFGWYPDPAHYIRCSYNPSRLTLYLFGELRKNKFSNRQLFDALVEYGYNPEDLLIPDSAEPKSIADLREYGANVRGADKGPDSISYSIKWLQSLKEIVIDPVRCPYALDEFLSYEYEVTKDGEVINAYPDANNHAIDATRYATNRIWIRRGQ